jgi:hypothetical protein
LWMSQPACWIAGVMNLVQMSLSDSDFLSICNPPQAELDIPGRIVTDAGFATCVAHSNSDAMRPYLPHLTFGSAPASFPPARCVTACITGPDCLASTWKAKEPAPGPEPDFSPMILVFPAVHLDVSRWP